MDRGDEDVSLELIKPKQDDCKVEGRGVLQLLKPTQ